MSEIRGRGIKTGKHVVQDALLRKSRTDREMAEDASVKRRDLVPVPNIHDHVQDALLGRYSARRKLVFPK